MSTLFAEIEAVVRPDCVLASPSRERVRRYMRRRTWRTFEDAEAGRNRLTQQPDCSGHVGVIGFCMGGGFGVASVNHGTVPKDSAFRAAPEHFPNC
jgi:dienelactone hydrolase